MYILNIYCNHHIYQNQWVINKLISSITQFMYINELLPIQDEKLIDLNKRIIIHRSNRTMNYPNILESNMTPID